MDRTSLAQQVNALFRLVGQNLSITDSEKMQIPDLYPAWEAGRKYSANTIVKYGVNADGETQLYNVLQEHTSQGNWAPGATPALYKKIGFTDAGVPIWTQPLGATDVYAKGDRVSYGGAVWKSDIDANVWQPGVHGWTKE